MCLGLNVSLKEGETCYHHGYDPCQLSDSAFFLFFLYMFSYCLLCVPFILNDVHAALCRMSLVCDFILAVKCLEYLEKHYTAYMY